MSDSFAKLAAAVVLAAVLLGCAVLVLFGVHGAGAKTGAALQLVAGFGIGAAVSSVAVIFRAPILWFVVTVVVMLVAMVGILMSWTFLAVGAGAALVDAAVVWYAWIRPVTSKPFNHVDYAKEQARLYEEEKARREGGPGAVRPQ